MINWIPPRAIIVGYGDAVRVCGGFTDHNSRYLIISSKKISSFWIETSHCKDVLSD